MCVWLHRGEGNFLVSGLTEEKQAFFVKQLLFIYLEETETVATK